MLAIGIPWGHVVGRRDPPMAHEDLVELWGVSG